MIILLNSICHVPLLLTHLPGLCPLVILVLLQVQLIYSTPFPTSHPSDDGSTLIMASRVPLYLLFTIIYGRGGGWEDIALSHVYKHAY